ncbi:Protein IQ-DOMAIN 9 [Linum grandiflorum]
MGSGNWIKTMMNLKKGKNGYPKQLKGSSPSAKSNGFRLKKVSTADFHAKSRLLNIPVEDLAATHIQTAYRAYRARRALRRLKGTVRLQTRTKHQSVAKQANSTLNHLHLWSSMQAQIRTRRQFMVTEGRSRQKKLENQLKLEAKLHGVEVEWNSGCETMEEILARIHQREEAAVKRERAMAYAFSHQWRANCNQSLGGYEVGKANWGWSWMDRWIAARPWESRVVPAKPTTITTPKKSQNKQNNKVGNKISSTNSPSTAKTPASSKLSSNGGTKARRLSYPVTGKQPSTLDRSRKAAEMEDIKPEAAASASSAAILVS